MSIPDILDYLNKMKSIEVKFEEGKVLITEYKGISKTTADDVKSLMKGRKGKLDKERKQLILEISKILIENSVPFKIIFEKDPLIKFDVDRYVVIAPDSVKIFGFNKIDHPLSIIYGKLEGFAKCYFYKPVR